MIEVHMSAEKCYIWLHFAIFIRYLNQDRTKGKKIEVPDGDVHISMPMERAVFF